MRCRGARDRGFPSYGRGVRRGLVGLAVVAGLLVVGDRVAVTVAERAVGTQLMTAAELDTRPDVDISGFPFLTQAVSGRYAAVHVEAAGVPTDGVRVAALSADLEVLEVALSDALGGTVTEAPVERLTARALVSYADLSRQSGSRRLTVAREGAGVAVTGSVVVLGRRLTATAISTVRLDRGDIVVRAQQFRVGAEVADDALTAALGDRLDLRVKVGALPYGLELESLAAEADGIALAAAGGPTVLTPT